MVKGRRRVGEFDAEYVRDVSEAVYRLDLGARDTASMLSADGDGGVKLRRRAGGYDRMTEVYLRVILGGGEVEPADDRVAGDVGGVSLFAD